MTKRLAGAIVACTFVIGALAGSAAVIVTRDASLASTDLTALMADHMSGDGTASMITMMGMMSRSMMGPNASMEAGGMGPGASQTPGDQHDAHHPGG